MDTVQGSLPTQVTEALERIWEGCDGVTADDLETATLDFKEDPVHHRGGNPDAKAVELLIDAMVCFANGDAGDAWLVFGIGDRRSGPEAFTGTDRDAMALTGKIFNATRPNLRVEPTVVTVHGCRIIAFRVPAGLTVYTRTSGAATYRDGDRCRPLEGEVRRHLEYRRANPDYTARASSVGADQLDPDALAHARELIARTRTTRGDTTPPPQTTGEILRLLDLLTASGGMTVAAEILFHRRPGDRPLARFLYRNSPMGQPTVTELREPLVLMFGRLHDLVRLHADAEIARVDLGLGQEAPVPTFPAQAVDEVITNALVHRDWGLMDAVVVDQSALTLTVTSPGGLPAGVRVDRLLSTPSRPRNPCLMNALRVLGLVEQSSRGFDRMWLAMLSTGREVPTVDVDDYSVSVSMYAGEPDADFIRVLAGVRSTFGDEISGDVGCVAVLRYLTRHSVLSLSSSAKLLETSESQASQIMTFMGGKNVVIPGDTGRGDWVLSEQSRDLLGASMDVPPAVPTVQRWIEERVAAGNSVTNRDVVTATGADPREVTTILRYLQTSGVLTKDPTGPGRGPAVRWIAV
ncbi:ATP-binding protein [Corynebacterium variabile]|uniref:ATP-binding protein n=1 Tax=Corynebacterium variabile TaxID=1727 RepID=UPI0028B159A1|nr:ATP-binding protein [Corynebacterium variabile]